MVKFVVSGKSEGPGPMDFMVLTTFRFIRKSWNAVIVKVFLEFAKKRPLVKDLHICSTRPLFHGRQPKNYVLDVYFCHYQVPVISTFPMGPSDYTVFASRGCMGSAVTYANVRLVVFRIHRSEFL
jgi:hypothetical protein